jgi:hypothetical protein
MRRSVRGCRVDYVQQHSGADFFEDGDGFGGEPAAHTYHIRPATFAGGNEVSAQFRAVGSRSR